MTLDECDEMIEDLKRVGVRTGTVQFDEEMGDWKFACWCPVREQFYWVANARLYRVMVGLGLVPHVPREAFDYRTD